MAIITIAFDPAKDAANIGKHGISLARAGELLDTDTLIETEDRRFDYGETRIIAIGEIEGRIFVCVYTRRGSTVRPISLRPANRKERYVYHQARGR